MKLHRHRQSPSARITCSSGFISKTDYGKMDVNYENNFMELQQTT